MKNVLDSAKAMCVESGKGKVRNRRDGRGRNDKRLLHGVNDGLGRIYERCVETGLERYRNERNE